MSGKGSPEIILRGLIHITILRGTSPSDDLPLD